ncbi:MAG: ornithine cyclodeaminase family protein [Blastocatellia bacterium]
MLILNEADLRSVLKMREVIDAVERGFHAIATGDAVAPERLRLSVPNRDSVLLHMPSYLGRQARKGDEPALGTKIVGVFPENPGRSLEVVQAVYLLFDPETGVPMSLMEGRFITGIRTAATSAVATKHMATAGTKQLAVFGAGIQARFHIDAMIEVATIARIMIASRTAQKAHELAGQVRALHRIPCEVVSAEEAATQADLICTCTTSPTPLFDGTIVRAGTHINAVGAFTPLNRELDTATVLRSRVIIDAGSAAGQEAGEILIPLTEGAIQASHVKGTLAEVVSGGLAGRESSEEITLFRSCGLAIEDLVTAKLAYEKAIAQGIGVRVEL